MVGTDLRYPTPGQPTPDMPGSLLDARYHPDFADIEAEREFYHFAVVTDATTRRM